MLCWRFHAPTRTLPTPLENNLLIKVVSRNQLWLKFESRLSNASSERGAWSCQNCEYNDVASRKSGSVVLTYFVDGVVREGFLLDDRKRQVVRYAEDRYKQENCNYCSFGQIHRPNPLIRRLRATVLMAERVAVCGEKDRMVS